MEDSQHWKGHSPIAREFRINERIRTREVRVIGANGEQLGVMTVPQALDIARENGVDLVEVAPTAVPPVCRILDYGKFKYEQAKKERDSKKNQHNVMLREIRFKPKIDDHDIDFKTRAAEKLIKEGDKVKVTVMFRGREITHPQIGRQLLDRVYDRLKEIAAVEKPAGMEGRHMTMILVPGHAKAPKPPRQPAPVGESSAGPAVPSPANGAADSIPTFAPPA